jgi:hypothetical protein
MVQSPQALSAPPYSFQIFAKVAIIFVTLQGLTGNGINLLKL